MNQKPVLAGGLLIVASIIFFILNINALRHPWVLAFMGLALFLLYMSLGGIQHKGNLGLLFTALLLVAIPMYDLLRSFEFAKNDLFLLSIILGSCFLAILLLHTAFDFPNPSGARFWPLLPGGILLFTAFSSLGSIALWPIIFLTSGLIMIFKAR